MRYFLVSTKPLFGLLWLSSSPLWVRMRCRNQRGGKRGVKARFQQKEENCGSQFKAKHPGKKKYNEHFEEKKKSKQTKKYLYTISRLERNEPTTESSLYLCSKYVHLVLSVFGLNNYIINW